MSNSWFIETEAFLLHEIVALLDGLARKNVLEPRGLSYSEFLVAMAARELDTPTQNEVGGLLEMSKSLVSQRVATLVAKGIMLQTRDPANRRQVRLELTQTGAKTLEEVYSLLATNADELFNSLGSERSDFAKTLKHLAKLLAVEAGKRGAHTGGHPFHQPEE